MFIRTFDLTCLTHMHCLRAGHEDAARILQADVGIRAADGVGQRHRAGHRGDESFARCVRDAPRRIQGFRGEGLGAFHCSEDLFCVEGNCET